jgi:hypothetical protein
MEETEQESFNWGELGEQWWRDAGAQFKSSEQQIKFACAKHRGASNAGAAREAGYRGDEDSIRQSGYKAFRTTSVQNLLALAAAEAKGGHDGTVDGGEAKRILSKLARGADPNIRIRAIEAMHRMDERSATPTGFELDGYSEQRLVREFLTMEGGGVAVAFLWRGHDWIGNLPLLHDVRNAVMRDTPAIWDWLLNDATKRASRESMESLRNKLADHEYQIADRAKMWREIGMDIPGMNYTPDLSKYSDSNETLGRGLISAQPQPD